MGRMHAPGKGMSSSALPYVRKAPNWLRLSKDEIVDSIMKLSKKGYRPSAIGVQIRDQYGVSQSKYVTGNKILRVLKAQGMAPEIREDLYFLIKKAVTVRKHLEKIERTNTVNFDLFLSNPESTDWRDTTNSTKSWPQPGNTTPPPPPLWLHNFELIFEKMIKSCSFLKFAWY